jgi:hypothetical protein
MIAVVDDEYIVERLPNTSKKNKFRVQKYSTPQYFESTESDPVIAYRHHKQDHLIIKKIDGKTIHRSLLVGFTSPPTYRLYIEETGETFWSTHINIAKAYQEQKASKGEPMELS